MLSHYQIKDFHTIRLRTGKQGRSALAGTGSALQQQRVAGFFAGLVLPDYDVPEYGGYAAPAESQKGFGSE